MNTLVQSVGVAVIVCLLLWWACSEANAHVQRRIDAAFASRDEARRCHPSNFVPEPQQSDVEQCVAAAIALTREEPVSEATERWLRRHG